jgi:hypothetical protein
VVAPTVSDPSSFSVWREEAFELWTAEWGSAYEEGSASRALLKDIANTWWVQGCHISPRILPRARTVSSASVDQPWQRAMHQLLRCAVLTSLAGLLPVKHLYECSLTCVRMPLQVPCEHRGQRLCGAGPVCRPHRRWG